MDDLYMKFTEKIEQGLDIGKPAYHLCMIYSIADSKVYWKNIKEMELWQNG